MTREPDTMPSGKTAIEALRLMEDGRYRHLPVVDGAGLWALSPASISAASNWIAWTKRPVCGRGSDGRNQRTRTADPEVRPTTLPNTAEEEAREPAMATDELLQEQRKSAGVGLSSSMPALAPT